MKNTICIIGALKDEISGVRERMEIHETLSAGAGSAFLGTWHQKQILLIASGIGRYRAKQALESVCGRFPLSIILSIGFAGALNADLSLGDLVVADTICEVTGQKEQKTRERKNLLFVDEIWVEKALKVGLSEPLVRRRGGLVTIDEPVCKPNEKMRLGEAYSALAVDMESYVLLNVTLKKGIPFLSLRAISDTVDQELVDFSNYIDPKGEVSKIKAGWYVLTHPGLILQVETLRKGARAATKNLTRFLEKFIPSLP